MGEEGDKNVGPNLESDGNTHNLPDASLFEDSSHTQQNARNRARPPLGPSRSQPPRTSPQASQSKNFEFVLVTDNESRRQVRRHAMRQYMHQRRIDSIARLETSRLPVGGWTSRKPLDGFVSETPSTTVDIDDGNFSPSDTKFSVEQRRHPAGKGKVPSRMPIPKLHSAKRGDPSPPSKAGPECPKPQIGLGGGGTQDPFGSYPIPVCYADHQLIQHFVVTYPSMMYKFVDSLPNNPMMEIFRQFALHDDLPFQAMLAIASKHRAGVEGKTESVQSLTHKMRALRLMNERIQADSVGQCDGTIYAVATMAVIEKWSRDASIERMHFRGLASMLRHRGGMRGMRASCPFLEKVLYWVDFSCAPKAIVGGSLPWTGSIPDMPPASLDFLTSELHLADPHYPTSIEDAETYDQFRACEDFLRFFRHLEVLERAVLNHHGSIVADSSSRIKCFSPGTRLHAIITMLPDYDHGIRDIRFIDEYTCMTCLFFLAIGLYDSYLKSTNFDHYINWLDTEITKLNPYSNPSITSIMWLFLNNGGYPAGYPSDAGDRCWAVSRMVRVAKRLEWKRQGTIWDRIRQVLIDFLATQQDCALGSDSVDAEALAARRVRNQMPREYFWDEDELRNDILGVDQDGV
ncbi:uncharacterized protein BDW47DRAFT_96110 [Aspergillus candidus]|uniref:Uncharacterized protein n=1 Tax=Aspergillus candidus TaxID=41067 RepID=A0A2I2EY78_ASPCN|nr:hypothetical protein BDW47DRAFT_96110 [Aspergillus candidus]PLB33333.1 hypothetical protein BDW47DRAFT_96110 [Aspergillus candidus]